MQALGSILLTSTGLMESGVLDRFKKIIAEKCLKKAIIITTATREKEKNEKVQGVFLCLKRLNLELVQFHDFENDPVTNLTSADIFYVCGGNTFKLLKFARQCNFQEYVEILLRNDGVYIGVSAGSIILAPSVQIVLEINPDVNDVNITDFTGFNIIDFLVFPHYEPKYEEEIRIFETRNNVFVKRITNKQAILLKDNDEELI